MVTKKTIAPTISATAVPIVLSGTDGLVAEGGGMPSPTLDEPASADALAPRVVAMRGRIHRIAGMVHQTIDKIAQNLNSTVENVMATQGRYGEQARQYGDKLRERINARPLQSAGVALGAALVLHKVFRRQPKVRVVHVPVHTPSPLYSSQFPSRSATRPTHGADSGMQRLRAVGQEAVGKVGTAADVGIAVIKAMSSTLMRKASTLPLQMRLATQRLLASSQKYGSMARSGAQAHPAIGIGAVVVGVGALLGAVWLQRRRPVAGTAYVTVDANGNGVDLGRDPVEVQTRTRAVVSSRPVTAAVVALGLGALVGVILKRR